MSSRRLLSLTGRAFKAGGFDEAVLPIGSTEYHGEHLPYRIDALVAEAIADAVAGEFRADNPEMKIAVLKAWWETAASLLPEGT